MSRSDPRAQCSTCRSWDRGTSECRHLPPGDKGWPTVQRTEWCGAHTMVLIDDEEGES